MLRREVTFKFKTTAEWALCHEVLSERGIGHKMSSSGGYLIVRSELDDDTTAEEAQRLVLLAIAEKLSEREKKNKRRMIDPPGRRRPRRRPYVHSFSAALTSRHRIGIDPTVCMSCGAGDVRLFPIFNHRLPGCCHKCLPATHARFEAIRDYFLTHFSKGKQEHATSSSATAQHYSPPQTMAASIR